MTDKNTSRLTTDIAIDPSAAVTNALRDIDFSKTTASIAEKALRNLNFGSIAAAGVTQAINRLATIQAEAKEAKEPAEDQTPEYSPLDAFKETALRVDDLLSYVTDQIGGSDDVDTELAEYWAELLDAARKILVEGLGLVVDDARWDRALAVYGPQTRVYDDGSPIKESYQFLTGDQAVFDYYPRLDGPLEEHKQKFLPRPALKEILRSEFEAADRADGKRAPEILDAALRGEVTNEQLSVVAHVGVDERKPWRDVTADDLEYIAADHPHRDLLIAQVGIHGTFGAAIGRQ